MESKPFQITDEMVKDFIRKHSFGNTQLDNWEDWKNGMWEKSDTPLIHEQQAISILSDPDQCTYSMQRVINEWPICTRQALTDTSSNRKSWLGQAACSLQSGVPESITRTAWFKLTPDQRDQANNIAQKIIEEWVKNYSAQMC